MKRVGVVALLALCGCATLPPSTTFTVFQQIQIREVAGLYPPDWGIEGNSHAAHLARLEAWTDQRGITLAPAKLARHQLYGHASYGGAGWVVLIDKDQPVNMRFYTLLHELGHVYSPKLGPRNAYHEVFAELTALQVCRNVGLDASGATTAYLSEKIAIEDQSAVVDRWGREIDRVVALLTRASQEASSSGTSIAALSGHRSGAR